MILVVVNTGVKPKHACEVQDLARSMAEKPFVLLPVTWDAV